MLADHSVAIQGSVLYRTYQRPTVSDMSRYIGTEGTFFVRVRYSAFPNRSSQHFLSSLVYVR